MKVLSLKNVRIYLFLLFALSVSSWAFAEDSGKDKACRTGQKPTTNSATGQLQGALQLATGQPTTRDSSSHENSWENFIQSTGAASSPYIAWNAHNYWSATEADVRKIVNGDPMIHFPPHSQILNKPVTEMNVSTNDITKAVASEEDITRVPHNRERKIVDNLIDKIRHRKPDELLIISAGAIHGLDLFARLPEDLRNEVNFVADPQDLNTPVSSTLVRVLERDSLPGNTFGAHDGAVSYAAIMARTYFHSQISKDLDDPKVLFSKRVSKPGVIVYLDSHRSGAKAVGESLPSAKALRQLNFTHVTYVQESFLDAVDYSADEFATFMHYGQRNKVENKIRYQELLDGGFDDATLVSSPLLIEFPNLNSLYIGIKKISSDQENKIIVRYTGLETFLESVSMANATIAKLDPVTSARLQEEAVKMEDERTARLRIQLASDDFKEAIKKAFEKEPIFITPNGVSPQQKGINPDDLKEFPDDLKEFREAIIRSIQDVENTENYVYKNADLGFEEDLINGKVVSWQKDGVRHYLRLENLKYQAMGKGTRDETTNENWKKFFQELQLKAKTNPILKKIIEDEHLVAEKMPAMRKIEIDRVGPYLEWQDENGIFEMVSLEAGIYWAGVATGNGASSDRATPERMRAFILKAKKQADTDPALRSLLQKYDIDRLQIGRS